MADQTIAVLGGGVGGLVTASELRKRLGKEHRVVLVDKEGRHVLPGLPPLACGSAQADPPRAVAAPDARATPDEGAPRNLWACGSRAAIPPELPQRLRMVGPHRPLCNIRLNPFLRPDSTYPTSLWVVWHNPPGWLQIGNHPLKRGAPGPFPTTTARGVIGGPGACRRSGVAAPPRWVTKDRPGGPGRLAFAPLRSF